MQYHPILSDSICQIKRHKGRGRYEVFIHNTDFRAFAKSIKLTLVGDEGEDKQIEKKLLTKYFHYALMIKDFLNLLQRRKQDHQFVTSSIESFNKEVKDVLPHLNQDEEEQEKRLAPIRQTLAIESQYG